MEYGNVKGPMVNPNANVGKLASFGLMTDGL